MTTLSSTTFLANRLPNSDFDVAFEALDEDLPEYWRHVSMDQATWLELGSPDVITVTIQPGDRLNGPD